MATALQSNTQATLHGHVIKANGRLLLSTLLQPRQRLVFLQVVASFPSPALFILFALLFATVFSLGYECQSSGTISPAGTETISLCHQSDWCRRTISVGVSYYYYFYYYYFYYYQCCYCYHSIIITLFLENATTSQQCGRMRNYDYCIHREFTDTIVVYHRLVLQSQYQQSRNVLQ